MNKLYIFIFIIFLSSSISAQTDKKWAVYSEVGYSQIPFWYGGEKENLNGVDLKFGLKYNYRHFFGGVSLNHSSSSKIYNPKNFQLGYNNDISVVTYGDEFYQETTFANHNSISFNVGYDFHVVKSIFIRSLLGYEWTSFKESRTIIYAPGNNIPTKVGYDRNDHIYPDFEFRLGVMKSIKYINIGVMSSITWATRNKSINVIVETRF